MLIRIHQPHGADVHPSHEIFKDEPDIRHPGVYGILGLMDERPGDPAPLGYAENVSPSEAYAELQACADAVLVDVRTIAEWSYVGLPDLTQVGKKVIFLEWQHFPDGTVNTGFVEQLRDAGVVEGVPAYFLCRSGVRSVAAAKAATAAGLGPAYNVSDGFEGQLGSDGNRAVSGWKAAGLPWRQA